MPRATPTSIKLLKGVRPARINLLEPMPSIGEVTVPDWLGDRAKEVWEQYAPDLVARDVLTPWDSDAFAVWCDLVANLRRASALLAKSNVLVQGPGGRLETSPALRTVQSLAEQVASIGGRFGLTPADRQRIELGPAPTPKDKHGSSFLTPSR